MCQKRLSFRSATYVFLVKDHSVMLTRRFNTGYKDGQYSTISGHIDPKESVVECAVREAFEEARVNISSENLKLFHVMNRYTDHDYIDFFFKCSVWEGSPQIGEPNLCDNLQWFEVESLPVNTIDYIREVLRNIHQTITYSTFGS